MKLAWEKVVCVQKEQGWGRGGGDGPKANSRRFAHHAENKGATNSYLRTSVCCQGINQGGGGPKSELGFNVQSSYAVGGHTKAQARTLK